MNRWLFLLLLPLILCEQALHAQQPAPPHEAQQREYGSDRVRTEQEWDRINRERGFRYTSPERPVLRKRTQEECDPDHIVFGWHPYWMGTAYEDYDYGLLSDLSYFSYEVDPNTGNYQTIHSWKTTDLITRAKEAGRRVNLCVTLFSGHATFFGNPDARRTLIDSLIALVKLRDADGVNIDFESVPGSQRENMTGFMRQLGERFDAELPGSQISIDLPAVDWQKTFDVVGMEPYVDLFIIMGYAYHWTGSQQAGPNAPKNNGSFWSPYDLTRSINYYLDLGLPSRKLCLGLPWYGHGWGTTSDQLGSATLGRGNALFYSAIRQDLDTNERMRQWDIHSSTPWYAYEVGENLWRQHWYDDEISLGLKYDLAIMKGLAGVAIWALGYDGGYPEMWEALRSRFADCGRTPCGGELTDMGGPTGNYVANDLWSYTIRPEGATSITLAFSQFDLADDHLLVFDGPDENAPLIADLTGASPGAHVTGRNGTMTIRFVSNESQQGTGFLGTWACSTLPLSLEEESDSAFSVSLNPNPSTGESSLRITLRRASEVRVTLHDMAGRMLGEFVMELAAGEGIIELGEIVRPLAAGAYFLRVETETGEKKMVSVMKAGR